MRKFEFYILLMQLMHALAEDVVSYENYRVYEVFEKGFQSPTLDVTEKHKKLLMLRESHEIDEMNHSYTLRSYLVPEPEEKAFQKTLRRSGTAYRVLTDDLEKDMLKERKSVEKKERRTFGNDAGVGEDYYSYKEMIDFLQEIIKIKNPDNDSPLAVVEPIGKTYEGRPMHLVKISSDHSAQKPVIFLEAGMHAREWTASSAALYTIYQLVENFTHTAEALADTDYYIVPLSNPDGYEYSRTKDRMWRKTRSFFGGRFGVDGNRNFDFHWGESGSSSDPSSDIFRGPRPFSEPETRNIRDAGKKYMRRIAAFISVHAYGPAIVYPWSYKKLSAPQSDVMGKIAQEAVEAIKRYNRTRYRHGVSSVLMYQASGGSDDYFKAILGVDLSFTVELSSGKKKSFVVPAENIRGIVAEAFEGFKAISSGAVAYRKKRLLTKSEIMK